MLTRRKKQNLLYMGIGILIGFIISACIAYFSLIKQFTKSNFNKIQQVLPIQEKDTLKNPTVVKMNLSKQKQNTNKIEVEMQESIQDSLEMPGDSNKVGLIEIIKTDHKIETRVLPVISIEIESDTVVNFETYPNEITVEQWENPTNFAGYRKQADLLIIYGINIDDIELQYENKTLYLVYKDQRLAIQESDSFFRFPLSFIQP